MEHNPIKDLLDRYLKHETSGEENQIVEQWLADNGNADPAWEQLDHTEKERWLSSLLDDINETIQTDAPNAIRPKVSRYLWYRIAGAAAILLLISGLYLSWPLYRPKTPAPELMSAAARGHQKRQLTLDDGTSVWLNAGSTLRYPKLFKGKSRVVYLSGEAYFDVQHDAARPFMIYTGKVLTTVLGTAFNIKEDQRKHTLEVTVTRGKVSVADDGRLLSVLTRNEQLSLNLLSRKATASTVDPERVLAWQKDEFEFDDVTLLEAALQLEKHFHVKIGFENEQLKHCRFSGRALRSDQLDKILSVITGFNNANWKRTPEGRIVIYGKGCS